MRLDELFAQPATLYIHRTLTNGAALLDWAHSVGMVDLLPPQDLHVTLAYSKKKTRWQRFPPDTTPLVDSNPHRSLAQFGAALVLCLDNPALQARFRTLRDDLGVSWDFPSYQPHVSLSYQPQPVDPTKIKPFAGKLVFGPEIFGMIDESWAKQRKAA